MEQTAIAGASAVRALRLRSASNTQATLATPESEKRFGRIGENHL